MSDADDVTMDSGREEPVYISPIAHPRVTGKPLKRSIKLLRRAMALEKLAKQHRLESSSDVDIVLTRLVKRGVQDVTKALRKGIKGIVLLACDVHPVDVIAHLPVLCEDANLAYAYITSKRVLSQVCQSKRPTCVVLIAEPPKDLSQRIKKLFAENNEKLNYTELYGKVEKAIRSDHPFL
ncbi:putative ribosomal protein L7Ae-related protein [Babesia divergens]|uniref:Ribosomal protein L7Ae-related protein n=1 Tax=Babesia divergens TaxID=32595 RepID=A0AAD9LK78_BABDI|nr:putative ribosomal protein L7Ae-related protein [Babesia divergens]